ncbi:hypothetical protein MRB53_029388 [Persea americana]|uniref:Uncharacterized protein n=1 Tax=Persea americana TaxID=3435 RepID=A0ACC2KIB0_PERAE|nr:hypothetical protein MRB53_029388 [Persea americana]
MDSLFSKKQSQAIPPCDFLETSPTASITSSSSLILNRRLACNGLICRHPLTLSFSFSDLLRVRPDSSFLFPLPLRLPLSRQKGEEKTKLHKTKAQKRKKFETRLLKPGFQFQNPDSD